MRRRRGSPSSPRRRRRTRRRTGRCRASPTCFIWATRAFRRCSPTGSRASTPRATSTPRSPQRSSLTHGEVIMTREGHAVSQFAVAFYAPDSEQAGLLARAQEIENLQRQTRAQALVSEESRARLVRAEAASTDAAAHLAASQREAAQQQSNAHRQHLELVRLSQLAEQASQRREQLGGERAALETELAELAARRREGESALRRARRRARRRAGAPGRARRSDARREQRARCGARRAPRARAQAPGGAVRAALARGASSGARAPGRDRARAAAGQPRRRRRARRRARAAHRRAGAGRAAGGARDAARARAAARREAQPVRRPRRSSCAAPTRCASVTSRRCSRCATRSARSSSKRRRRSSAARNTPSSSTQRTSTATRSRASIEEGGVRLAGLQAKIDALNRDIEALGAVNLAALEELGQARERKGFLDAQSADLGEAMATLEDAIRKIDLETRDLARNRPSTRSTSTSAACSRPSSAAARRGS